VTIDELKILLALEPRWTVSVNGKEFLNLRAEEIELDGSSLRFGRFARRVLSVRYLRSNVFRIEARSRLRSKADSLVLYAGDRLPSAAELHKRRRAFLQLLSPAVETHFGARIAGKTLHSDRQRGIGGAYARLLVGKKVAVIAVDSDETAPVVNSVVRSAIQWAGVLKRRIAIVVPSGRSQTIAARIRSIPTLRKGFEWLEWDGESLRPLQWQTSAVETYVHPYTEPAVQPEVRRVLSLAPRLLLAIPHIAGKGGSIRLRGIEIARVTEGATAYPLGEPLESVIEKLAAERRAGSSHPLARAHEEAWLESNLIGQIRDLLPVRKDFIYPQVPSFAGEERKIIDLLTITDSGRLAVIEIKASPDPDLPFQALDYWLAVEHHRKAGDFTANGYFRNIEIRDEPALLVVVAPLLSFHRSLERLTAFLPPELPLMQVGLNQGWKKEIKILRRKGALG